jgi:Family of unknown function (DUF5681)
MVEDDIESRPYEVGFGKPPKSGQYKRGQSGNPSGRPKGAKNLKTILRKVLLTLVPAVIGGRRLKMTATEALLRQMLNKAVSGDLRATTQLISLIKELKIEFTEERRTDKASGLSSEELSKLSTAELQRLFAEKLAEQNPAYDVDGKKW